MPQRQTIRVEGLREFNRAIRSADKESRTEVRGALREAGDVVRDDWTNRLELIDSRSAAGLRTRVRARGVSVEQSIRRTTGTRPDYGSLQMRRGVAALESKARETEDAVEDALERVCDHFNRGGF